MGRSNYQGEVIAELKIKGAQVNAACHTGVSPLLVAAAVDHSKAVQVLLEAGVGPCLADCSGTTALHRSIFFVGQSTAS